MLVRGKWGPELRYTNVHSKFTTFKQLLAGRSRESNPLRHMGKLRSSSHQLRGGETKISPRHQMPNCRTRQHHHRHSTIFTTPSSREPHVISNIENYYTLKQFSLVKPCFIHVLYQSTKKWSFLRGFT